MKQFFRHFYPSTHTMQQRCLFNGGFIINRNKIIIKKNHLTLADCSYIEISLNQNKSIREIAKALERSPSTIAREIKRNATRKIAKHNDCKNKSECSMQHLCSNDCNLYCNHCDRCHRYCDDYDNFAGQFSSFYKSYIWRRTSM